MGPANDPFGFGSSLLASVNVQAPSGGFSLQDSHSNIPFADCKINCPNTYEGLFQTGAIFLIGNVALDGFNGGFATSAGLSASLSAGFSLEPTTAPIPAAFLLFATGLGAIGIGGWRRKKVAVKPSKQHSRGLGRALSTAGAVTLAALMTLGSSDRALAVGYPVGVWQLVGPKADFPFPIYASLEISGAYLPDFFSTNPPVQAVLFWSALIASDHGGYLNFSGGVSNVPFANCKFNCPPTSGSFDANGGDLIYILGEVTGMGGAHGGVVTINVSVPAGYSLVLTPVPAALPLFATGLIFIVAIHRRRKKKAFGSGLRDQT